MIDTRSRGAPVGYLMVALAAFWLKYRGIGVFWVGEEEKD